jgi:hypothetical protein
MRYWDGADWTLQTRPIVESPAEGDSAGALVPLGYILSIIIPIVGFVLGIVAVTRPNKAASKHGPWIIVVSVLAFIAWLAILVSAAHSTATTSTYTGY